MAKGKGAHPTPAGSQSLGAYLANVRDTKRLTLRDVEEVTDRAVSNAYLSQLETGKISKPSPNILYILAQVYAVSYELLMEKAGYIVEPAERDAKERHGRVATFADEALTRDEEEQLLQYLAFLRTRRSK